MMPVPGFRAGTLNEDGYPAWITDLDNDGDNADRTVHVVRGLAPADALQVVGARLALITPCRLPAQRPDNGTSLPRAAIGPTDSGAVLLAGQVGSWSFIYDDSGMTSLAQDGVPPVKMLSAGGREAATCTDGSNLNPHLAYAVDGELLLEVIDDGISPADDNIPAGLRAAVAAACNLESGDDEDDELYYGINMRVVCALAGLNITPGELGELPLLAAPFS
jgi:hypothetical protein